MKMKNTILRTLIVIMVAILGIGIVLPSLAYTRKENDLSLSYFRYVNGNYTNGYGLNTVGNSGMSHHPIYQIMSNDKKTNFYCLNAIVGDSWRTGHIGENGEQSTYNLVYDLSSDDEITALKGDTNVAYKKIGDSAYLKQILWILDNIYIPDTSESANDNLAKKRELLSKAGIVYDNVIESVDMQDVVTDNKTYKYVPQQGYDFREQLFNIKDSNNKSIYDSNITPNGWFYNDTSGNFHYVEMPDELVEVAQQAALWYFTNYLDTQNNENLNDQTFNVREQGLRLICSNGTTNTSSPDWPVLEGNTFDVETDVAGYTAHIGNWQQEMATILCWYLIDAAMDNASSATTTAQGVPLTITPETANLSEKSVNNTNYYVVGPIKIDETRSAVYKLYDTIKVNNDESTGAYISNAEGTRNSDQTISNYIGQKIYIAVPKSKVSGDRIQITFRGNYNKNEKKLLVNATKAEQPVVEVTPNDIDFELNVSAPIQKEFDLALRKRIIAINGKSTADDIKNEAGLSAVRASDNIDTSSIPNTATYKHRKDPVVVKKGDIVTYSITIYNEGEIDGYAKTIVDKLPQGLALKGFTDNKITTGTFKKGNVNYSYVYNKDNNTITFTNNSENVLSKFEGTLASETIEIECEVVGEPSTTTKTYLTNIAYISEAYKKETETPEKVEEDRDSRTDRNPSATQNTTGDKYTGYHGGDNTKDVYSDTNNQIYFPGQEDDDDFEIIVLKPAVFDLALQKYIAEIMPENKPDSDSTTKGRNAPTIDTTKLANGTATTATYIQDKTPIKVKSGDYVLYTITAYNEGEVDGTVEKITDNIPTGLEFVMPIGENTIRSVDSQGNTKDIKVSDAVYNYVWNINEYWTIDHYENKDLIKDHYNGEETISITCDVKKATQIDIGGESDEWSNEGHLKAYDSIKDKNHGYDGTGLDRVSVRVVLRVGAQDGTGDIIRNEAAITQAKDNFGKIQDTPKEAPEVTDRDSQTNQWPGKDGDKNYQDDEDFDNIILPKVDLALTKFITAISNDLKIEDGEYKTKDTTSKNAGSKENPYDRATMVDTTPLKNGEHNAKYTQIKTPLPIPAESYVLYNIRVYNEGEVDVYAGEVKDYLPENLIFVENAPINNQYGWKLVSDSSDKQIVVTDYLSKEKNEDKILKAFDKENGTNLDFEDLPILCRVSTKTPDKTILVNSAEITKYEDEDGNEIDKDIDSEPNNLPEDKKNKEGKPEGRYDQDDEDYEQVKIEKPIVDLALTKFIAAKSNDAIISDGEYLTPNHNEGSKENPYDRATKVDTTQLKDDPNCHDAEYIMVKDPLEIPAQSYVLYNIRVYNEGQTNVYAGEVTDKLPQELVFVENAPINKLYGWKVAEDGKTISTTYLSHNANPDKILKAFDRVNDDKHGSGLDYQDLQVLCKISDDAATNKHIINIAEITRYENEDGDPIPEDDIDSRPNNVNEKNEDDDDYEVVLIKTFDLSLLKYVSEVYVTEDGKTTTTKTGNTGDNSKDIIPKVEINKKKLSSTVVKFGYTIKITNEGDIEGYAKEITDYVPEGLKFYAEDNNGWTDEGNNVISTRLLENTLLKPGESAEVKVIFRWINGSNNLGLKTNVAEISEDYNKEGVPDRDSTPDNRKEGEDDIDDAKVILSIKTGLVYNAVMYASAGLIILIVLGMGISIIKKYVL